MPDGSPLRKAHRRPFRKPRKGHMLAVLYAPVAHDPDDLCGGRRLTGAEFMKWKAHYEAIDRAERAKRKPTP